MTCHHSNADRLMPGQSFANPLHKFFETYTACVEQLRCLNCGAWLSLGPANDGKGSDFTIKMEIRAAALAAMPAGAFARGDEWAGWDAHDNGDDMPRSADGDEAPCWYAGYLARQIATHEET